MDLHQRFRKHRWPALLIGALLTSAHAQSSALNPAEAQSSDSGRPRWEAGVAGVALRAPDYPGADEYRNFALPVPYFIYYGRVLRADENEGSRLRQKMTPNVELALSGGGTLSSDSSNSDARRGMPDLDYLIQLGPSLRLSYPGPQPRSKFIVRVPLRAAASVGSGLAWHGIATAPDVSYLREGLLDGRLALRVSVGSEFASTALHRYYYDVAPQDATSERPAYRAKAGYLGSGIDLSGRYRFTRKLRGFVALGYANHAGSANEHSPLLRSDDGYTVATGFSWSFWQSAARAEE